MLYIFDCMVGMFLGDAKYVLASTGEAMCWKDVAVGFLAYLAIVSLIVGIGNLIPFLLYNKGEHGKYVGLKKASRKCFFVISIIFLTLCPVSVVLHKKNPGKNCRDFFIAY